MLVLFVGHVVTGLPLRLARYTICAPESGYPQQQYRITDQHGCYRGLEQSMQFKSQTHLCPVRSARENEGLL